ncbi:MAG: hypothetical protein JXQ96_11745 [Cyclobacteriaceae bacterium]
MRELHRYLGFFLAGIMFVYALSGIVLIYRKTDVFKVDIQITKEIKSELLAEEVGNAIKKKELIFSHEEGNVKLFEGGQYNSSTGEVIYTQKGWPTALDKLIKLHMASTKDSLFFLNIFFGLSLMIFVFSSFFMFSPKTKTFRRGVLVSLIGLAFALALVYL